MATPIIGTLPVILTNGTIADATQVMADFNYILAQVNANGAPATGGLYLPLTGGTLTGTLVVPSNLVINGANSTPKSLLYQTAGLNRWVVASSGTAESTGNVGSDFNIYRYNDAGTLIDSSLSITRSTGTVTIPGIFNNTGGNATFGNGAGFVQVILNRANANSSNLFYQMGGLSRWNISVTGGESSGNAGSSFLISRYNDAGTLIDTPLSIDRPTGQVNTGSLLTVNGGNPACIVDSTAGQFRQFVGRTAGLSRWVLTLGDGTAEGGSNAGSNCTLAAYNDAGTLIGNAFSIVRSTRVVTFTQTIVNSDRRLKTDIAPIEDALTTIAALQGVTYHRKAEPERRHIGLIAQDVREVLPEVVHESAERSEDGDALLGVDYAKLTAVLIEAIKELTARVASLEAKVQST